MRAREFLVEYDRNKTGQALGNQLLAAAQGDRTYHGPSDDINQILATIEAKDPTPNKEYTTWMARMYAKGGLPIEDLNRNDWLGLYNQAKKRRMVKPEHADIGRFRTYGDFENTMADNYDPDQIDNAGEKEAVKGRSKLYFENSDVRIIIPEDETAAIYYGQGTKWCTAATRGRNYFDDYNEDGPLFIILFKKSPDKWQFHFETASFMDAQDQELKPTQVQQVSKYFSDDLWEAAVEEDGYIIQYIADPSEAAQLTAVDFDGLAIEYIKNPSEAAQLAAVEQNGYIIKHIANPSEAAQLAAVKETGYAISYIKTPSEAVQMAAVKENGVAIKYIKNPSESVQMAAVKEYGRAIEYIKNPSEKIKALAAMRNKR